MPALTRTLASAVLALAAASASASAEQYSDGLSAALGVQVADTRTVGPGRYVVEPDITVSTDLIRLEVTHDGLGYYTGNNTPQRLLLVRRYNPRRLPEIDCIAIVLEQTIANDALVWDRVAAFADGFPAACGSIVEDPSTVSLCTGQVALERGAVVATDLQRSLFRLDFHESPPSVSRLDVPAVDGDGGKDCGTDLFVADLTKSGALQTVFERMPNPESLHPKWDVDLVASLDKLLSDKEYQFRWDDDTQQRTIATEALDVAASVRRYLTENGIVFETKEVWDHQPSGLVRRQETIVSGQ